MISMNSSVSVLFFYLFCNYAKDDQKKDPNVRFLLLQSIATLC